MLLSKKWAHKPSSLETARAKMAAPVLAPERGPGLVPVLQRPHAQRAGCKAPLTQEKLAFPRFSLPLWVLMLRS